MALTHDSVKILLGDSAEVLKSQETDSIDSVVTDPPYGISYLNSKWDYDVPSLEIWQECLRALKPGGYLLSFSSARTYHRIASAIEDAGFEIRDQIMWMYGSGMPKPKCLKPAHEPIVLARKPFKGTLKDVHASYGTGYLNLDACRVPPGRVAANIIHDGSGDFTEILPTTKSVKRKAEWNKEYPTTNSYTPKRTDYGDHNTYDDYGSVMRYFYCAKANKKERGETNNHPTVKPIKLMEYLVKLVTPDCGVVLDPFMGSGSTGVAALNLNRNFIGIERDPTYFEIAQQRLNNLST